MHSLAPYSVRVRDANLPGPPGDRYCKLGNVRGLDLLKELEGFAKKNSDAFVCIESGKTKRTLRFSNCVVENREFLGLIEYGEYGIRGKVVDVQSSTTVYRKTVKDADLHQLYFHFLVPSNSTVAIGAFHNISGRGVKGLFVDLFNQQFVTSSGGLVLQVRAVSYEKAVEEWMKNSVVKQLKLKRYVAKEDLADAADALKEHTSDLIIRPRRKGADLGSFWEFSKYAKHPGKERKLVELLGQRCHAIKAVVEHNGRQRVFSLAANTSPVASIELSESDVEIVEGAPKFASMRSYCAGLLKELIEKT